MKISVVIPTYNRAKLLSAAIQSVLAQTFPAHEILVCDDGSTDDSAKIVRAFNNPKVIWVECGRNGRPSIPRNIGIQKSTGDYIAFLDSDDEWLPEKLAVQCDILQRGFVACCTNAYRIGRGEVISYFGNDGGEIDFVKMLAGNSVICSSMLIRKETLMEVSLFPEQEEYKAIEDYALWLRLLTQITIQYVHQPLVNYLDENEGSIRVRYNSFEEIQAVVIPGIEKWIDAKKIKLKKKNRYNLYVRLKLIKRDYKLSLLDRIRIRVYGIFA
jgi:teichuronic acid biosynthesis glycosyltransferase TuaG